MILSGAMVISDTYRAIVARTLIGTGANVKRAGQVERTRPVVAIIQMTSISYGQGTPQSFDMANISGL